LPNGIFGPSSVPVAGRGRAVETDISLVRLTTSRIAVNPAQIEAEIYLANLRLFHALLRAREILAIESRYIIKPDIKGAAVFMHG
jgi:hypothetical protein